uniref:Oxidation resistance protein 1 n=1 Tax=Ostreococcus mediterraneus TaxID=1486918 RepID=A0A7S0KL95_9CHLO
MEEVLGNLWGQLVGESSSETDADGDDEALGSDSEYVRISHRRTTSGDGDGDGDDGDGDGARRVMSPDDPLFPKVTKSTFIGVVRVGRGRVGRGTATVVDVLYRGAGGKSSSVRVRASDAHRGFVGKVLESFVKSMEGEDEDEDEDEGNGEDAKERGRAATRRGSSALSTSSEGIKLSLVDGAERGLGDIMTVEHMESLRRALPAMFRMRRWNLAYSTKRDGISLKSLYRHASAKEFTILVVSDSAGAIFGAFCTETWKIHTRYEGTGESFVFTLSPVGMKYAWSGENDYYMLGAADFLCVGGGSAHAIRLEEDLLQGSSGECETYGSPRLSSEDMFKTHRIELWSLE